MRHILEIIIVFVFITLISLMVYGVAQQMLRQGANNVPVQLAADVINKLESGVSVKSVALPTGIEISKSLSPFVIILDQNKKVLVSSATLNSQIIVIPAGVFDFVARNGEDRITWQPQAGIREAIVVDKYSAGGTSGFVVAGTSLKETESTIDKIGRDVIIGWIIINIFAVTSLALLTLFRKK